MSPVSKAQIKAVTKYTKANYDEIKLLLPKGKKELVKSFAQKQSKSLNSFVNEAIDEKIERDN